MSPRAIERALWVGAVVAASGALLTWRAGDRQVSVGRRTVWPAPIVSAALSPDSAAVLAERIAGSDPFRLERRPAAVPYRLDQGKSASVAANVTPRKPVLTLAGIVGGPPWAAVLNGVPGRESSVLVHPGDTLAGLRIRSVTARGVSVTGMDTVWRLVMNQPWR